MHVPLQVLTKMIATDWYKAEALDVADDSAAIHTDDSGGEHPEQRGRRGTVDTSCNKDAGAQQWPISPRKQNSVGWERPALPGVAAPGVPGALLRLSARTSGPLSRSDSEHSELSQSAGISEPEPPPASASASTSPTWQHPGAMPPHLRRSLDRALGSILGQQLPTSPRTKLHGCISRAHDRRNHSLRVMLNGEAGLPAFAAHGALPQELAHKIEQLLREPGCDALSMADLHALHESGTLTISEEAMEEQACEAQPKDSTADGMCTEANKHVVLGALDALEATKGFLSYVTEKEPKVVRTRFLLSMALQRYNPPVRLFSNPSCTYISSRTCATDCTVWVTSPTYAIQYTHQTLHAARLLEPC
jgi:hypothetical protein